MQLKSPRLWVTLAALGTGFACVADQDVWYDGGGVDRRVYGGPERPGSNAFSALPRAYDAPTVGYPPTPGPYPAAGSDSDGFGRPRAGLGTGAYAYPAPTAPVYRPRQQDRADGHRFDRPQAAYVPRPTWDEFQSNGWTPSAPAMLPAWDSSARSQKLPPYGESALSPYGGLVAPGSLAPRGPGASGSMSVPTDRAGPFPWSSGQVYYPGITDLGIPVPDDLSVGYSAGGAHQPQFRPRERAPAAGYGQQGAPRNPWPGGAPGQIPEMAAPWGSGAPPQYRGPDRDSWNPWANRSPPGAAY